MMLTRSTVTMTGVGLFAARILLAQGAERQEVAKEVAEPVISAVLEVRGGRQSEGLATFEGDSVVITPAEGAAMSTPLGEIASLLVTIEHKEKKPEEKNLLSGALPAPWRSKDIGRLAVPGKGRWKEGRFMVFASPRAEGERFDAYHMVYMPMQGDGEIVARVVKVDNRDEDSYGGIVMCDGLTPENRKAVLGVHPFGEKGVNFRRWGYQGGSSTGQEIPSLQLPYWVKLVREEYDVSAYYSPDGRRWRFLKKSPGRMRDEQIYVGLVARVHKFHRLSEVVFDRVSVNGMGSKPAEPMLPHVVLRSGSRLAADLARADRSGFHFKGRWKEQAVTAPQVARVEFFHPLPDDLRQTVQGGRTGLLLRTGDFAEGEFQSLDAEKLTLGSVLFGIREYSILDEVDALVLREVVEGPASCRVETQAGSILLARKASLVNGDLELEVAGLGRVRLRLEEIRTFRSLVTQD